ncbi:MFS transporter [Thermodesulfobacteriota bacterium]
MPDDQNTYKWKAMVTVAMGATMATMDNSITNIAFPTLTETFNSELTTVMWVTVAYFLVSTSSMLVLGKVSDLIGRKRIYSLGMGIFTVGLITCSLAQSINQLIFFRIVQACGSAMTVSCSAAIITEAFPAEETGRGLGLFGMFVSLGFILGPVLGGLLLHWINWQAIFFMRVPIGFIIFFMAITLLKEKERTTGDIKLDFPGTFISSAGMFCLVFGVSRIKQFGLKSPFVHLLLGLGLLFFVIFILIERRTKDPIIDLILFKNRVFSSAVLSLFLNFLAVPAFILIMPFYLIQGIGMTPSRAGLLLGVQATASMIFGPLSGWLSDHFGRARFTTAGAVATTIAYCIMLTFDCQTALSTIVLVLILMGVAYGTFHPPINSTIMGGVPRDRLGTASALIATLRQVGVLVGMAVAGTLFSARKGFYEEELTLKGISSIDAARMAINPAFHDALIISIFLSFLVILFCLYTGRIEKN